MFKPWTWVGVIVLACVVLGLFQVKYKVQYLKEELVQLEGQIVYEKETIHVLKAEWAYLTQPSRLKVLADRHLDMAYVDSAQIKSNTMEVASEATEDVYKARQVQEGPVSVMRPTLRPILTKY